MQAKTVSNLTLLGGRALLSSLFISAGLGKIAGYAGTQAYMESFGIPGLLLPAVIALEFFGGLAILAGIRVKPVALALAAFTLVAAVVFHGDFSQPMQSILFSKNLAVAGGFLLLFAQGPGEWTLPALTGPRRVKA